MNKKFHWFIGLLAALVLLTGCLDVEEELTIQEDGSGTFRLAIIMDSSLAALMEDGESQAFFDPAGFENTEQNTYYDPDGNQVEELVIYFDDIEAFVEEFNQSGTESGLKLGYQKDGRRITITHSIAGSGADDEDNVFSEYEDLLTAQVTEGMEWRLTITTPNIENSNGRYEEGAVSAEWLIPFTVLNSEHIHEAYVEYLGPEEIEIPQVLEQLEEEGLVDLSFLEDEDKSIINLVIMLGAAACCLGSLLLVVVVIAVALYLMLRPKPRPQVIIRNAVDQVDRPENNN